MGRAPDPKPVQILYIGRIDPAHEKHWEQLGQEGFAIAYATSQKAGLEMAVQLQPHVVVVNTSADHVSAERLCRTLGRRIPSAKRLLIVDRKASADLPCEQALQRPFTARKLRDTLFKMLEDCVTHVIRAGVLELDVIGRRVSGPNGQHHLTPKERNLLATFMQSPNCIISRKDLMETIWDTEYLGDTRTLDVHIRWVREKIEADPARPALLVTRRGVGYELTVPDLPEPGDGESEETWR